GKTAESLNPSRNAEVLGSYQLSSANDLDEAVVAASQSQKGWRKLSGSTRGDYLFKVAAVMEERLESIAETMTKEMGKTFAEAKGETARGVAILRYYAGEGMRSVGDV
ncbi:aldehyde dehydrogenase family protein, partial [Staphylococcus sp. SIMBA_130]